MGLFDQFPYTNFHNLNLDWIIGQIKNIKSAVSSTAEDAAIASESAEAAAASAGSAAGSAAYAGNAAALVQQVRDDLDTVNTEMTNFVQAHSGLYNETVLWSGTASAQGDTIELSDDIRNYKYIDVQATYKGATSSSSSLGTFPSNVVRFTPEVFTEDNAVLNIPYAYEDQLQICTVFMFWDSLDPTDYTKISLGYTRRVSINDHGDLDNAADPGTVIVKIVGVKNIADAEVIDARVGEDDTVYPTLKQRLDGEYSDLKSAINEAAQTGGSGSGLTAQIKQALLNIFQHVQYLDDGGVDAYDALEEALGSTHATSVRISPTSLSFASIGATQQLTATLVPSDAVDTITWSSSDSSIATVSNTGLVTSVAYGTAIITATAGAVSADCSVLVAQATVSSISATYTQSGVVYDTASLDSLKADLVVTANWSNGTTTTVADNDYSLSGTLTEGTSVVTVSYGGKTTTFNVTVTALTPLYAWDLTQGLAGTVGGITATTNATQDSEGVKFNANNKYVNFGAIYGWNRTYQIDIGSMAWEKQMDYGRLWMIATSAATGSGGSGYILTKYKGGDEFYNGGSWEDKILVANNQSGAFYSGKTVSIYVKSDGVASVYVDGTYIGDSARSLPAVANQNIYFGASASDSLVNTVFTGFRVYEGLVI